MARPKKKVDLEKLRNLAMIGCSHEVIASKLGVSHDTLTRRYREVLEEARGDGVIRILGKIFQSALAGNSRMLELSAINRLHWALKPELVVNVTQNASPALTMAEFRRQTVEAEQMAKQYFDELQAQKQLSDGNGSRDLGSI